VRTKSKRCFAASTSASIRDGCLSARARRAHARGAVR
jgi:hypothetical protein